MKNNYSCKICDEYSTNRVCELNRHLTKKKPCMKSIKSFDYSNDQLIVLSLTPNDELENVKTKICHLDKSNIIYKNKLELLSIIKMIDIDKLKKCTLCNEEYSKISELKEHVILNCFYEKLKKSNIEIINTNYSIDGDHNNMTNTINSNNTINNITNIYLDIKPPIPFDENWDMSKIDNMIKESLIFSKIMYTNLLTEILKNEINLNVIISEDNDSGIVYKNDIDKYIKMKSEDIVDKTMQKLKEQLLDINSKSYETCLDDCLRSSKMNINKKYENYTNNRDDIKNNVTKMIKTIYTSKKEDALEICKNVSKKDNLCDDIYQY